MRRKLIAMILPFFLISPPSYGIWGDGGAGWAQIPYLVKILAENYKRYKQLKMMMDQAKRSDNYFKTIHQGLENITGLMQSLPIDDHGVLKELRDFNKSLKTVANIYGRIPKSPEPKLRSPFAQLHPRTLSDPRNAAELWRGDCGSAAHLHE